MQIWEDDLKNGRPLSIIIPVVVYHGDKGWEQIPFKSHFTGLPKGWGAFIPGFLYLLTDLGSMPDQIIRHKTENEYLRSLFLTLKFARNKKLIKENWRAILTFEGPFHKNKSGKL